MQINYKKTAIKGMGIDIPPIIMTSEAIEVELKELYHHLKLPFGRLEMMTGIKARKFYPPNTLPSDIATNAAKQLFETSALKKNQVDLLINASVCRDFLEPATASIIHHKLELSSHCAFLDVANACLGVLSAIQLAATAIEMGHIKNALITSGENGTALKDSTLSFLKSKIDDPHFTRRDIKKFIASLTIGSGGLAIWLGENQNLETDHALISSVSLSDSKASNLCQGDGNHQNLMMETNSEKLLESGVALASKTFDLFKSQNSNIDWMIGHQVGSAHEEAIEKVTSIKNIHATYEDWGNTGSAAWGITLYQAQNLNKLKKETTGAIFGIGSGLSTILLSVRW